MYTIQELLTPAQAETEKTDPITKSAQRVPIRTRFFKLARSREVALRMAREAQATQNLGDIITAGFKQAAADAIRDAHARGLAVPVRVDGQLVERRPDGAMAVLDPTVDWSPDD